MKRLLGFTVVLILVGCSGAGTPVKPSIIKVQNSKEEFKPPCTLPAWRDLVDEKKLSVGLVHSTADCIDKQIDKAFETIQGEKENALTVEEIRILQKKKIIEFPFSSDEEWEVFSEILKIIHPNGKPILLKEVLKRFVNWGRSQSSLYVDFFFASQNKKAQHRLVLDRFDRGVIAAESLLELISSEWRLSLDRILKLYNSISKIANKGERKSVGYSPEKIEALWILKGLIFQDKNHEGTRADLSGEQIQDLASVVLKMVRNATQTRKWAYHGFIPEEIPELLAEEWTLVTKIFIQYIEERNFSPVDARLLQWSLKNISPRDRWLIGLVPDLVRITQKLSRGKVYEGLHPVALIPFLNRSYHMGEVLKKSTLAFKDCPDIQNCAIPFKKALQDPILSLLASNRIIYYFGDVKKILENEVHLKEQPFNWSEAPALLFKKEIVDVLFNAFDPESQESIPLAGEYQSDLSQIFDLSQTLIRFISSGMGSSSNENIEHVPTGIPIRPSSLSNILGLLGDRWTWGGNADGNLDKNELFSIVQFNSNVDILSSGLLSDYYYLAVPDNGDFEKVFSRYDFINSFQERLQSWYPWLAQVVGEMNPSIRNSLFHSLIGLNKTRPRHFFSPYTTSGIREKIYLTHFVSASDSVAPAALLVGIQELMLRCDADDDNQLSWEEMDCALPLALEAGSMVLSSGMLEVEPGVFDAARFLLKLLQTKGLPLEITKLIVFNGSVTDFSRAEHQMKEVWSEIVDNSSISMESAIKKSTGMMQEMGIRSLYVIADFNKDGKISGKKEWDALQGVLINLLMSALDKYIPEFSMKDNREIFERLRDSGVLKLGISLFLEENLEVKNLIKKYPIYAHPRQILFLLEEILRRSTPLEQMLNEVDKESMRKGDE